MHKTVLFWNIVVALTLGATTPVFAARERMIPKDAVAALPASTLTEQIAEDVCGSGSEYEPATQLLVALARQPEISKLPLAQERASREAKRLTTVMQNKVFQSMESLCAWSAMSPSLGLEKLYEDLKTTDDAWTDPRCAPPKTYDHSGMQPGASQFFNPMNNIRKKWQDLHRAERCLALLEDSFPKAVVAGAKSRLMLQQTDKGIFAFSPTYPDLRTTCQNEKQPFLKLTPAMTCIMRSQSAIRKVKGQVMLMTEIPVKTFGGSLSPGFPKGAESLSEVPNAIPGLK